MGALGHAPHAKYRCAYIAIAIMHVVPERQVLLWKYCMEEPLAFPFPTPLIVYIHIASCA